MTNIKIHEPTIGQFLSKVFEYSSGGQMSLLGIGEKGTPQEGKYRKRVFVAQDQGKAVFAHVADWAEKGVAAFFVPATIKDSAVVFGDVTLDRIVGFTSIVLDLDCGDVDAKVAYVSSALGTPSMIVASGGKTGEGQAKRHLWYMLNEETDAVERVAFLRKLLAMKCGGDQSFGRATQVIRIAGSIHAKNGILSPVELLECNDLEYSLDDLAETIEAMQPMPGLPEPAQSQLPVLAGGMMDFSPRFDTATVALSRDIDEGGTDRTRWGEFSKVAGLKINEARAGRITLEAAYNDIGGWVLAHMNPPWPAARINQEFAGLLNKDIETHGAMPQIAPPWSHVANDVDLPFIHSANIEAPLTNAWRVRNLLPAEGLAAIYGSPGAGKSFLALDIAQRIAGGMPVDGRAVKQAPTIYIAAEGASGVKRRVVAWRRHHGIEGEFPFALIPCPVDLLNPNADLRRLIDRIQREIPRLGASPGAIFVDTLAATFAGGDENTNAMVAYVNNLAALRDAFGALIVVVHHRPKDQQNDTLRGHSSLAGAMDTILRVDGTDIRTASIVKQKDAEAGSPIAFRLVNVSLGLDEEGEPVGAAVVEFVTVPKSKQLSPAAAAVLRALTEMADEAEGGRVLEGAWRDRWAESLPPAMQEETRRKAWARAKTMLNQSGRIKQEAGYWSIVSNALAGTTVMDFTPIAMAA